MRRMGGGSQRRQWHEPIAESTLQRGFRGVCPRGGGSHTEDGSGNSFELRMRTLGAKSLPGAPANCGVGEQVGAGLDTNRRTCKRFNDLEAHPLLGTA